MLQGSGKRASQRLTGDPWKGRMRFARPNEAIVELVPGDAWMPDDRMKRGKIVADLAARKVTAQ
jgi:hypothetical protein